MDQTSLVAIFLVGLVMILNANGDFWEGSVDTNSSHWSIYRESTDNISFNLSSSVDGKVSPVEFNGRVLAPYQGYYEEIRANDVRSRQRISSREGFYKSSDEITMKVVGNYTSMTNIIYKPIGSDIYTIEYRNEIWPVFFKAERALNYLGHNINNRDFDGNNGDFVGTNFLYNQELLKEKITINWLQRANVTVLATDESIVLAEFKPNKYLGYLIRSNITGIADLSYRLRDSKYDFKRQKYPALSEGDERYSGSYYLGRKIEMRSEYKNSIYLDDETAGIDDERIEEWLPCCFERCYMLQRPPDPFPSDGIDTGAE